MKLLAALLFVLSPLAHADAPISYTDVDVHDELFADAVWTPISCGNYCGAGKAGNWYTQKPTDSVDAACAKHDRCLLSNGHADGSAYCPCDAALAANLEAVLENPQSTYTSCGQWFAWAAIKWARWWRGGRNCGGN